MSFPTKSSRWRSQQRSHWHIQFFILGCLLLWALTLILGPQLVQFSRSRESTNYLYTPIKPDLELQPGECSVWKKVNANAFGLPPAVDLSGKPTQPNSDTPFSGEEGFEALVFKNQLYLGMEADNALGARLWRTRIGITTPRSQLDWEEVIADEEGKPFGVTNLAQADHIDSLAVFQGWIYASTANRSGNPRGTLVFRSRSGNPGTWIDALEIIGPGFGKSQNENFKDMQVFDGYLCGGTWNEIDGAEVWCTSDGKNWQQKNNSGFGESSNMIIWSGHVFDGHLYLGVQNIGDPTVDGDNQGRLYRTASLSEPPNWEEVFRTEKGVSWGNILGDLDGYLYISVPSDDGVLVYRSSNGDRDSWNIASLPGFNNNPDNFTIVADGAAIYKDSLYVGVSNSRSNFAIWRSNGIPDEGDDQLVTWEQIPMQGLNDPYNIYVQLIPFNEALYAWTSNPVSGQQVWHIICARNASY